jgi:hypothetical protein
LAENGVELQSVSEAVSDIVEDEDVSDEEETVEVNDLDDDKDAGSGRESREDDKRAGVWIVLTN